MPALKHLTLSYYQNAKNKYTAIYTLFAVDNFLDGGVTEAGIHAV